MRVKSINWRVMVFQVTKDSNTSESSQIRMTKDSWKDNPSR